MKVDSLSNSIKTKASNQPSNAQLRTQTPSSSRSVATSSNVEITKALLSVKTDLSTESTFNTEKVNQIKIAIEEGRFEVNSAAVANSLIATANDLLSTQSQRR